MATVYCIGVVSEANYATFAALCVPSLAGDDYGAFLKNVSDTRADLNAKGVVTLDVDIDPVRLEHWLAGRRCTPSTLASYAAFAVERKVDP